MAFHPRAGPVPLHPVLHSVQLQAQRGGAPLARTLPLGLGLLDGRRPVRPHGRLPLIVSRHVLSKVGNQSQGQMLKVAMFPVRTFDCLDCSK